jgi:uncharacterized protein YutE (UPF0331/DUF86 family)
VVDIERLFRLCRGIEADVAFLARFSGQDVAGIVNDEVLLGSIKYRFVTAIEGCAKVAHHMAASEAWPVAETNADAIRVLAKQGVLTHELAASIAAAVGFRNLLVHQYGEIDDQLTVGHLARLDDLRAFVHSVERWTGGE